MNVNSRRALVNRAAGHCLLQTLAPVASGCRSLRDRRQAGRLDDYETHTRALAEGLWKDESECTAREDIVIYEVMAEELDEAWWQVCREALESRFRRSR
jgi:hypothetical protein